MILYFSGTGNSKFIAEKIASVAGDSVISINDRIKAGDTSCIEADGRLVFSLPTYAWRIPRVVNRWIADTEFKNSGSVWFVMNCGGEIGNAAKYNIELCRKKGFDYMGTKQIIMPENFISMFNAPDSEQASRIIAMAEPDIESAADYIKAEKPFDKSRSNIYDRLMSGLINGIFYSMCVKADPYYAKENCTGCGKCEILCPLNNIKISDGRPVWGNNCTQCMACICHCPVEAIEYGKKSAGKPRYHWD